MEYSIGQIVLLYSGISVYITSIDENAQEYCGYDTNIEDTTEEIVFKNDDVMMFLV